MSAFRGPRVNRGSQMTEFMSRITAIFCNPLSTSLTASLYEFPGIFHRLRSFLNDQNCNAIHT